MSYGTSRIEKSPFSLVPFDLLLMILLGPGNIMQPSNTTNNGRNLKIFRHYIHKISCLCHKRQNLFQLGAKTR